MFSTLTAYIFLPDLKRQANLLKTIGLISTWVLSIFVHVMSFPNLLKWSLLLRLALSSKWDCQRARFWAWRADSTCLLGATAHFKRQAILKRRRLKTTALAFRASAASCLPWHLQAVVAWKTSSKHKETRSTNNPNSKQYFIDSRHHHHHHHHHHLLLLLLLRHRYHILIFLIPQHPYSLGNIRAVVIVHSFIASFSHLTTMAMLHQLGYSMLLTTKCLYMGNWLGNWCLPICEKS